MKKFEEAFVDLDKIEIIDKNYRDLFYARGNVYRDMGDFVKARDAFITQLKMYPDDTGAMNQLAYVYIDLKDYKSAMVTINKAIDMEPNEYILLDSKGEVYENMGKLDKALELYEKALKGLEYSDDKETIEEVTMQIKRVKEKINAVAGTN